MDKQKIQELFNKYATDLAPDFETETMNICDFTKFIEENSIPIEPPVLLPNETLSCEQVRNNTIEECAKHLEKLAEKANDVLVEERHILQEDTVELFRNDIDHARKLANNLRELASKL